MPVSSDSKVKSTSVPLSYRLSFISADELLKVSHLFRDSLNAELARLHNLTYSNKSKEIYFYKKDNDSLIPFYLNRIISELVELGICCNFEKDGSYLLTTTDEKMSEITQEAHKLVRNIKEHETDAR